MTSAGGPLHVLLVDDNEDHRFLTRRALAALALDGRLVLHAACDGEEGLARARADPRPGLVLLDIKMPRCDGFDVLRELRADPRTAGLAVVLFTSSENGRDVARARELGADGYVTKPLDAHEFADAVRRVVDEWAARLRAPHEPHARPGERPGKA